MRVCVIGSGPSGLTTIKQLLDEGHDVTCFEKSESVGGIWYRGDSDDGSEMKAYDNLVLTISMKLMGYSDFMVEGDRVFYTRPKYLAYLEAYADKFDLRRHVSFGSAVSGVRKSAGGTFCVTVTKNGKEAEHVFDAVAVCAGPFQKPSFDVTDLDKFTGEIVHSAQYRNNERFRDKDVLVVGLAESGADVLREVSDVSASCTLSIRSRSFLLPRLPGGQFSTDAVTTRSHHYEMWVRATDEAYPMAALFGNDRLARMAFTTAARTYGLSMVAKNLVSKALGLDGAEAELPAINNMGEPMEPAKMDLGTAWTKAHVDAITEWNRQGYNNESNWTQKNIFCKNVTFIPNVVNGKIVVNDAGIERIEGKTVYFKDRTSKVFDAIVLCTGFKKDFSALGADIGVKDDNVRNLYKHAFHPDHEGRLAFIGYVRPYTGGIPICAEMQARYFALCCSDKIQLPSDVRERIQKEKAWEETFSSLSPRHTESIPSQILFLDSIAKEIGCLTRTRDLVRSPKLLLRHWFYPFNQSVYRLVGPHCMPEEAKRELMSDKPGPLTGNPVVVMFSLLSLLPSRVHPKYADVLRPRKTPPGFDGPNPARQLTADASL